VSERLVNGVVQTARKLVEHRPGHPVISLYLDLDPERFATAPGRASQIRSLIDEAAREIERESDLDHGDKIGLREDLKRIDAYLNSRDAPFQGARALAVFCSGRDGLFETVQLPRPVPGRVVMASAPYVEPLVEALQERRWLVVLVSRRAARLLAGPADTLHEREEFQDDVHGQHDQGGWSQANYERSVEKDVEDHLRRVADAVFRAWQRERFDRVAVGGPPEIVPRFEARLPDEVRSLLAAGRVDVDVGTATDEQVRAAVADMVQEDEKERERDALDRLAAGIGGGGRAVGGPEDTLEALNERRVETLLLEPGFDRRGFRCLGDGLLFLSTEDGRCPVDGSKLEELDDLREAAVEAALAQDAEVTVVRYYPNLGPLQGIGALLRF
jgi:peptide chain release factor subunit 1